MHFIEKYHTALLKYITQLHWSILHKPIVAVNDIVLKCTGNVDGTALKNVDTFKYLGSCINSAANLGDEVLCRISRASQAFGRLHTRVWQKRGISIKTKLSGDLSIGRRFYSQKVQ